MQKGSKAEAEADDTESVRSLKRARRLTPLEGQLSETNLRAFNGEMNSVANNIPVLKRTSSRRSVAASSEGETIRSQRSSNTTASYRYKHLAAADVHIHTDPSEDVQAAIDLIVKAEVSEDRRIKLCHIAKEFYEACKETVQAAAGEDDFVHIFRRALEAMNPDQILFREKPDWREELKPIPQQSDLNLSFLVDFNAMESDHQKEVDDVSTCWMSLCFAERYPTSPKLVGLWLNSWALCPAGTIGESFADEGWQFMFQLNRTAL